MIVICSFNVNRPGAEVEEIKGGVAGGSILRVSFLPEADSVTAVSAHYKLSVSFCNSWPYHSIVGCVQGVLKVGQKIEVQPGITTKDESGGIKCTHICRAE